MSTRAVREVRSPAAPIAVRTVATARPRLKSAASCFLATATTRGREAALGSRAAVQREMGGRAAHRPARGHAGG
eukprot:2494146-Prymnesium_polylepis.1